MRVVSRANLLFMGALLLSAVSTGAQNAPGTPILLPGASECPCLTSVSSDVSAAIRQAGFPSGYGVQGCNSYDDGLATIGCSENEELFCRNKWCYVNTTLCAFDAAKCAAAGGTEGSSVSPFCRTRPSSESTLFTNVSLTFSYHTCNSLDLYTTPVDQSAGATRTVRAAFPPEVVPYSFWDDEVDPKRPELRGSGGAATDIFYDIAYAFDPPLNIDFVEGWASDDSRALYGSSYTACAHDVALGRLDICVGAFWITPERTTLTHFLPAFADSMFYLSVPAEDKSAGLGTMLAKPFAPFAPELWGLIIGYVLLSGLVMVFTEGHNAEDFPNESRVAKACKAAYLSFMGYLSGGPANTPISVPGRVASLGFSFFVLITLASYTANLATILVAQSAHGGIQDIDDAISRGVKICIPSAMKQKLEALHPKALFVLVDDTNELPRYAHRGECECFIDTDARYRLMRGGVLHQHDCDDLEASGGALSEAETQCWWESEGVPVATRDCKFTRTGGLITSVPLSMPVAEDLVRSLSWAMVDLITRGVADQAMEAGRERFPADVCGAGEGASAEQDALSLPANAMAGTLVVSVSLMLIALVLAAVEHQTQRPLQQLLGLPLSEEADSAAGPGPQQQPALPLPLPLTAGPSGKLKLQPQGSMRRTMSGRGLHWYANAEGGGPVEAAMRQMEERLLAGLLAGLRTNLNNLNGHAGPGPQPPVQVQVQVGGGGGQADAQAVPQPDKLEPVMAWTPAVREGAGEGAGANGLPLHS